MRSCPIAVWAPHHLPSSFEDLGSLQPSHLTTAYTLLCVLRHEADTVACSVDPSRLPAPFSVFQLPFLPARGGPCTLAGDGSGATTASVRTPWLLVETCSDLATPHCSDTKSQPLNVGSAAHPVSLDAPSIEPLRLRHLHLGTLLYAPAWRSLFKRQTQANAPAVVDAICKDLGEKVKEDVHESTSSRVDEDMSQVAARVTTTAADREALAIFFPAFHHGQYFATPQDFERHCLCSDDHLLWCEDDPLVSVEWTARAALSRPAIVTTTDHEFKGLALTPPPQLSRNADTSTHALPPSRKRRRAWLLARQGGGSVPRKSRFSLQLAANSPAQIDTSDSQPLNNEGDKRSFFSEYALFTTHCAYTLHCRSECEDVSATKLTTFRKQPPLQDCLRKGFFAELDSYALWYSALRLACQASRARLSDNLTSKLPLSKFLSQQEAAADVAFHGIVSSLALWCSSHQTGLSAVTADNITTVAVLLDEWWKKFREEATTPRSPLSVHGSAAERRSVASSVADALQWAQHGRRWSERADADEASPAVKSTCASSFASMPAPLSLLAVDCATAITHQVRSVDRARCWSGARQPTRGLETQAGAVTSRKDDSSTVADATFSSTAAIQGAVGIVSRLSAEDTRLAREHYQNCLSLVLQLLMTDQQHQLQQT